MTRFVMASWCLALALAAAGCAKIPADPMQLDGGLLTVDNTTSDEWQRVEIWLNYYYRVTATSIPPHTRMQTPLDAFMAGFGWANVRRHNHELAVWAQQMLCEHFGVEPLSPTVETANAASHSTPLHFSTSIAGTYNVSDDSGTLATLVLQSGQEAVVSLPFAAGGVTKTFSIVKQ